MKQKIISIFAILLVLVMLIGSIPMSVFAYMEYNPEALENDNYYKLISKKDWTLAPGVEETEIVLNNTDGSKRQVVHSVKIDMNNPYTKVIPGYKGMIPTEGNYGTEATSTQAKNAEALGYGNVVAATNAMLSWYNTAYYTSNPHLIGEPLYYNILDGYYYENSQGAATFSKKNAVVVINYDVHPTTGETRPADMPKVLMRSQTDPLTGWEENAISVWEWLVKPDENGVPKPTYSVNHTSGHESRTFVGITADGEIILSVSDGRQAPYSTGFSMYEMGEYMIKMGCIYAANCDGGGSTTFVSQRPGEELKVNCSLSDGGERPTTNTFLVISTAPADGQFSMATIDSAYDYYTPGSIVEFSVLGTDAIGNKVDIPSDATLAVKEEGMGTVENGKFISSGKEGKVTIQMIYKGNVVGERIINIATPDKLSFSQPIVTIPYGEKAIIPVKATFGGGLYEIGLSGNDIDFTSSNSALGSIDGLYFIGAEKGVVPEGTTTSIVASLKSNPDITASVDVKLGEASVVMWDFEDGQADIDEWNAIVLRDPGEPHRDFYHKLSLATKEDGQVHNGNYSMRLETNGLSSKDVHSKQYAYVRLGLKDQKITLENARSIGFWLYVPEDNIQCWVQGYYKYDTNGDGVPDTLAEVNLMNSENMYYNVDESGWHYLSMDLSDFEKVDLTYSQPYDADPSDGLSGDKFEFFFTIIFHKSINNILWQTNGSINGPFTYYIDNITVDYSEVVEDREAPIFESVVIDNDGAKTNIGKHDVVTTKNNNLNIVANVAEATYRVDGTGTKHPLTNYTGINAASVKAYVDGVEVDCTFANGKISINGVAVADGFHRVKFEVYDNAGNKSSVVRLVEVKSGVKASTIKVVPAEPKLVETDRLNFGSIFWMNVEATNIETIKEVSTVIDLNNVNHWELDHMVVADGFSSNYTIDKETNTATITFTRTGDNYQVGGVILAQIPIRIIYFDTDMKIPGYTAETVWTKYTFWPHDLKVDVDMGKITYVDGYESSVLNTFSNEKFQVNTEMYTDFQSMGSDPYFIEHGTTHVHTPVVGNKAPTCTELGFSGGTYCEVCDSPVEWGTVIPATGHSFDEGNGIIHKCTVCGIYYSVDGLIGWNVINGVDYYFESDSSVVDGKYTVDGHTYVFENSKLIDAAWEHDGVGLTAWWAGEQLTNGDTIESSWYTINGNQYYFRGIYACTGVYRVMLPNAGGSKYYIFSDMGVWMSEVNGIYEYKDNVYFAKDGIALPAGLIQDADGNYYYINSSCKAVKDCKYAFNAEKSNGLLPAGEYVFGADGKMIITTEDPEQPEEPTIKNGLIHDEDGEIRYYKDGVPTRAGLVKDADGNYYYINSSLKAIKSCKYAFNATMSNGLLPAGEYEFGSDGKMIITTEEPEQPEEPTIKNGLIHDEDGEIRYYKDGVPTRAGLVKDADGNYYYINSSLKAIKSCKYAFNATMSNGLLPAGEYEFGSDGKMIITTEEPEQPEEPTIKNGLIHDEDGEIRYYKDDVPTRAGLVKDADGNYYYINSSLKAVKNCKYAFNTTMSNGLLPAGEYEFGADGKMLNPPAVM